MIFVLLVRILHVQNHLYVSSFRQLYILCSYLTVIGIVSTPHHFSSVLKFTAMANLGLLANVAKYTLQHSYKDNFIIL